MPNDREKSENIVLDVEKNDALDENIFMKAKIPKLTSEFCITFRSPVR